jgi:S1-C subfamily serine protease
MTGISACMLATSMFIGAPVPPDATPSPLGRGYMGIEFQQGSLTIEQVQPGEPASRAGLRPQDVIVRVGSLEPQFFDQVITHVCSFRPGAVIEIEVQRGNERKVFKLKLAARPLTLPLPNSPTEPDPVIP